MYNLYKGTRKHSSRIRTTCFSDSGRRVVQPPPSLDADSLDADPPEADCPGCRSPTPDADPPRMQTLPPRGQTNTCENITLSETSFAGGNNQINIKFRGRKLSKIVWVLYLNRTTTASEILDPPQEY